MSVNTKRKFTDISFLTTHFELLKYNFFIESLKFKANIIVLTFKTSKRSINPVFIEIS